MNPRNFFAELKRRNVYKVAIAYAVVAWLLLQLASILLPTFEAPAWVMKVFVTAIAFSFPVALILAWAFELTPEGIKRAEDVLPNESIAPKTGRKLTGLIIAVMAAAIVLLLFQIYRGKQSAGSSAVGVTTASPSTLEDNGKSIAVLPFQNLSKDEENAFFTNGVQDEILTILAKVADLKVISRTSVMQFKDPEKRNLPEIARALKVAHILEGSVQRVANRVRVTAQLIDARTDAHLWAERYDRELADVFAIQSEIAQKIADALQAKISRKEQTAIQAKPTNDLAAYDLYLRAKVIDQENVTRAENDKAAVALLEDAVARDPAFVAAFCLLARTHLKLYWFNFDHTPARVELAKRALEAAARLQPDAGEVHLTRGVLYYWGSRDYDPALAELALARRSLPNDSDVLNYLASIKRRQGQLAESATLFEQAVEIDPRNSRLLGELARNYRGLRRYDDAARLLDGVLSWQPADLSFARLRANVDFWRNGDLRRMQATLEGEAAKTASADDLANARLNLALLQRDYHAAERALAAYGPSDFPLGGWITPRELFAGKIWRKFGEEAKAQTAFAAARERAAAAVSERPDDAKALIVLAEVDAELNRRDEALAEGERAAALLPVEKDNNSGTELLERLASIYTTVGEKNRALDLLEKVMKLPFGPTYGDLKLSAKWDPLRGDPRFEKMVASLAPKDPSSQAK